MSAVHGKDRVEGIPVNEDGSIPEGLLEQADERPELAFRMTMGVGGKGKRKIPEDAELIKGDDGNLYYEEVKPGNRVSMHGGEPVTKTGTGYKVFLLKDGMLDPPMVGESKTGRKQVKAGGNGTQGCREALSDI